MLIFYLCSCYTYLLYSVLTLDSQFDANFLEAATLISGMREDKFKQLYTAAWKVKIFALKMFWVQFCSVISEMLSFDFVWIESYFTI
jgi:hypothetical protein